jgi:hypothetical protein
MFVGVLGVLLAAPFTATAMDGGPVLFLAPVVFGLRGVGSPVLAVLAGRRSPAIRRSVLSPAATGEAGGSPSA